MSSPNLIVIPARYQSSRFPGKPLALIHGKPMIQRVYEQCSQVGNCKVVIATDDKRIEKACIEFGANIFMTQKSHVSGTDRVAEVAKYSAEYRNIINVQGDEPCMHIEQIEKVINLLNSGANIATLKKKVDKGLIQEPNIVKVVTNILGKALYFSRSPIPYERNNFDEYFKHIGIYGFKRNILLEITKLKPSPMEKAESLEQLRWLENGYSIDCGITNLESPNVDQPSDISVVESYLKGIQD